MPLLIDKLESEGLLETKSFRSQAGSTATSASTLALDVASELVQFFTGSTAGQVAKLPDATTLKTGWQYEFWNMSTQNVAVQDNGSTQLFLLGPNQRAVLRLQSTSSAAGSWAYYVAEKTPQPEQFVTTYPGTGLAVNYTGGNVRFDGTLTQVAAGALTLPASTTGTMYVDTDGVVKATASIPAGAKPLYNFVTDTSSVTSLDDVREDIDDNWVWGVSSEISKINSQQSKAAGVLDKPARADHVHDVNMLKNRAGVVAAASFTGTPRKYTVTFTAAMPSATYAVKITGSDGRAWAYESRTENGFTINSQADQALTGDVSWEAIATGEAD